MQKNLVLAVILSSLVYIGWYSVMDKRIQPQIDQSKQQSQTAARPAADLPPASPAAQTEPAALPENWKEGAVTLKAGKAEYYFNSAAASIASTVYEGPVAPVELVPEAARGFFSATLPADFRLKTKTSDSVEFSARTGEFQFTKKFILSPDNGMNTIQITAENVSGKARTLGQWELRVGPGLGTVQTEMKENAALQQAAYTFQESGRKPPTFKELKDEPAQSDWVWAGLNNRYFLAALAGGNFQNTRPLKRLEKVGENAKTPMLVLPIPAVELKPGEKRTWEAQFYLGPKDYSRLKKLGMGLDRSVDFGFFSPLAKLANSSLVYFHKVTGNYGAAIVILSLIIQLLLTPLSYKSFKAMAVMKKIQPEMQAIQKKYKDDPKRMNQEVMDLYKRHGTNPLGGCLPMLLQIPVFFSLFNALRNSWSLHGAPFVFWIKDLSAPDTLFGHIPAAIPLVGGTAVGLLPLVMGGVMFLQQSMSPQTSDPSQAAMMKWMPIIFTFMFLNFPSGLVLYWLINSTWGFAQTMYLQKKMA